MNQTIGIHEACEFSVMSIDPKKSRFLAFNHQRNENDEQFGYFRSRRLTITNKQTEGLTFKYNGINQQHHWGHQ